MKELVKIDGLLQMWAYNVGHSQLLFRKTKNDIADEQIDILFKNVAHIRSAACIVQCTVAELDPHEVDAEFLSLIKDDRRVFRLSGIDGNNFVIAGAFEWIKTDDEYFDDSPLME